MWVTNNLIIRVIYYIDTFISMAIRIQNAHTDFKDAFSLVFYKSAGISMTFNEKYFLKLFTTQNKLTALRLGYL